MKAPRTVLAKKVIEKEGATALLEKIAAAERGDGTFVVSYKDGNIVRSIRARVVSDRYPPKR